MCTEAILTNDVSKSTEDELISLFKPQEPGIKCMGEEYPYMLSADSRRGILCSINEPNISEYNITYLRASWKSGGEDLIAEELVLSKEGWSGDVQTSRDIIQITTLDLEKISQESTLILEFEVIKKPNGGKESKETRNLEFKIFPVSKFKRLFC
ncbi:MAG: hypothetical protein KC506_03250 [Nanoarchaeota archaeon]|nr:hypothetical protein [Nanoarchaeota archaeon]